MFGVLIIFLFFVYYFVDKEFFIKKRVTRHEMWDYESGYHFRDFLHTNEIISFKGDTMIFLYKKGDNYIEDTLVLKWQYFGTMKVLDPKSGKTTKYGMKGANWMDYLFK